MPLASNINTFADEITSAYSDVKSEKSVQYFAKKRSKAIYNFLKTATPKTTILMPGPSGTGIGGIDNIAPGTGLNAALPILVQDLISAWTHGNAVGNPKTIAIKEGQAIMKFMLQAKVMTLDVGPITPPSFSGPTTGTGGLDSPTGGIGLDAALPLLEKELIRIWSQTKSVISTQSFAQQYAQAILTFTLSSKVSTTGVVGGGSGTSITGQLQ